MNFAFRNAWREIRNSRSFCIFYIINLALGLIGFLTVDSFKTSLEYKVEKNQKIYWELILQSGQGGT